MSDADIRRLERQAAGHPAARLELARAHERGGRPADALEALWRGCQNLAVRRAAAACDPRRAPVQAEPSQAWRQRLSVSESYRLVASPLALTLSSNNRTLALDPVSGELRCESHAGVVTRQQETLALLQWDGTLLGLDAWTGETLYTLRLRGRERWFGGAYVLERCREELLCSTFAEPRAAPQVLWSAKPGLGSADLAPFLWAFEQAIVLQDWHGAGARGSDVLVLDARTGAELHRPTWLGSAGTLRALCAGDLLVLTRGERAVVVDASTGRERLRLTNAKVSVHPGLLLVTDAEGGLRALAPDGEELWALPAVAGGREVLGVSDAVVSLRSYLRPGARHTIHARATGALLGELDPELETVTLVEDSHYASRPTEQGGDLVVAFDVAGAERWRWRLAPTEDPPRALYLAVLPGRLYVQRGREVACLVEAGGAPSGQE
ncbi:MAG: PQQ-binding-like beta-propeller repeat protein [Planctomycetota bacterium]